MSMEYIIFDGVDSRNYGVYVHGNHAYDRPARRAERVTVQGRHGLLTTSEDCFEESVVTYPVAIVSGFKTNLDAWLNALASRRGRHRLTDSFNSDEFRMASFLDAVEADPIGDSGAGKFEVTFQCLPQCYLLSGEAVQTYTASGSINNPTLFESQPLIRVYGAGTVGIGGVEVTVASSSYEYIDIDCDIMDCFHGTDNCNGLVSFSGNDFPTLPIGTTNISLNGVTKVEVTPRWWRV